MHNKRDYDDDVFEQRRDTAFIRKRSNKAKDDESDHYWALFNCVRLANKPWERIVMHLTDGNDYSMARSLELSLPKKRHL